MDLFFSLPDSPTAATFLSYTRKKLGGDFSGLSAFEYLGTNCRKYMDHESLFFHGDDQVGIYIQIPVHGDSEEVMEYWYELLVESELIADEEAIILIDTEKNRKLFLEARHSMPANAIEVVQHRQTFTIMTDAVVPDEHFAEFLKYTNELISSEGMDYLSFGHLADCHIHFTILPKQDQISKGTELYDLIIAKSAELDGVYSGEHGTGKRKRKDFLRCYSEDAAEQVRQAKAAVDPQYLLNRNNVVEMYTA